MFDDIEYTIGFFGILILSTIGCVVYFLCTRVFPADFISCTYSLLSMSLISEIYKFKSKNERNE